VKYVKESESSIDQLVQQITESDAVAQSQIIRFIQLFDIVLLFDPVPGTAIVVRMLVITSTSSASTIFVPRSLRRSKRRYVIPCVHMQ